jgi:hypothetical protein
MVLHPILSTAMDSAKAFNLTPRRGGGAYFSNACPDTLSHQRPAFGSAILRALMGMVE